MIGREVTIKISKMKKSSLISSKIIKSRLMKQCILSSKGQFRNRNAFGNWFQELSGKQTSKCIRTRQTSRNKIMTIRTTCLILLKNMNKEDSSRSLKLAYRKIRVSKSMYYIEPLLTLIWLDLPLVISISTIFCSKFLSMNWDFWKRRCMGLILNLCFSRDLHALIWGSF